MTVVPNDFGEHEMRKMNRPAGATGGFLFSLRLAAHALAACFLVQASPSIALETKADYAILLDMATGRVLFEKNADQQPAQETHAQGNQSQEKGNPAARW